VIADCRFEIADGKRQWLVASDSWRERRRSNLKLQISDWTRGRPVAREAGERFSRRDLKLQILRCRKAVASGEWLVAREKRKQFEIADFGLDMGKTCGEEAKAPA